MRKKIYLIFSGLAPIFVVLAAYFLGASAYLLAWECSIIVVLLMETRIQLMRRLARTTAFWIHVPFSAAYLGVLTYMTFWPHAVWVHGLVVLLFVISVSAGSVLWWRGLQAALN